ncbi:DUF927 domain-containing protein [Methanosarcina sp.]|uniref:DUF927 domain-containing protein n=1 Tax=Methanosarcina sp. TaxID=2213 RepID=UPI003BB5E1B8
MIDNIDRDEVVENYSVEQDEGNNTEIPTDFDDVLALDAIGNEELDTTDFNERIKEDFSFQITADRRLSQEVADLIGIDYKNPCKNDQYMTRAPYGREQYFGCFVPEGYFITQSGIWRMDQKKAQNGEIIETPVCICTTRVVPTGHFISNEGIDITELTFAGYKSHLEVLRVPTAALQSKQNYNKIVRNNNYGSLDILDDELNGTLTFLKAARKLNLEEGGTAFKTGQAYSRCGWTDKTCTKLVAGNQLMSDVNGKNIFEECIFIDDKLAHTFDSIGTIEGYFKAIKPLMHLDVVRFVIYSTFAAQLLHYYDTDSFTVDLYGGISGNVNDKSSSGKSTLLFIGIGGSGCVVENNRCISLIHQYQSSEPFIENLSSKICDFSLGIDETTNADVQAAEKRVYKATGGKTRGKASDGQGGIQLTTRKTNIVMFTGENSLLPDSANVGARVRVVSIRGGMGISNIGKLVSDAKVGCMNNYGHLLRPFVTEFFKQRHDNDLNEYFNKIADKFRDSTDDNLAQRRSRYFAVVATAGKLLEPIFAKYGIEEKNSYTVTKNIWEKHVLSNLIEAQWKQALREALNLYNTNKEANFDIPKVSGKLMFGWTKRVYGKDDGKSMTQIYFNKATLDEHLLKKKYNPDIAYESWREIGFTICNKPKMKKDENGNLIGEYKPYNYLTANKNGDQISVISFILEDVYKILDDIELEDSEKVIQMTRDEIDCVDNILKDF